MEKNMENQTESGNIQGAIGVIVQIPGIPRITPIMLLYIIPCITPLKGFGHVRVRLASIGNNPAATAVRIRRSASLITTKG